MNLKKFAGLGLAIALMAPAGVLAAQPAGAAGGTSCKTQTGTATITPGLGTTKKAQTITASTSLSGCTGGGVTKGTGKATIKLAPSNCSGLATTGTKTKLTETITWSNKMTSTVAGNSTTGPKVGQDTITGKITKGLFVGKSVSTVVAFTPAQKAPYCTDASPLKKLTIKGVKPFVVK